jgi:hypothetical protein
VMIAGMPIARAASAKAKSSNMSLPLSFSGQTPTHLIGSIGHRLCGA